MDTENGSNSKSSLMALSEYKAKRDFTRTPEPEGEEKPVSQGELRFVVQKHQASHLHYDLRLELDGVLKSWAVPKGPSMNPEIRRLAMMTEAHPLEYADFEGTIPKGSYGAGAMIIWDEGFFFIPGVEGKDENQAQFRKGLQRGSVKLFFEGKKLRGEFALVKSGVENNAWLFFKKKDQFASGKQEGFDERSVRSGLDVSELVGSSGKKSKKADQPDSQTGAEVLTGGEIFSDLILGGASRGSIPENVQPMLATLTEEPFDRDNWYFELKWDGFRAIGETHRQGEPVLYSRNQLDYAGEFPAILKELEKISFEAVFDGEIVVVDENGRSDFRLLQQFRKTGKGMLVYFVFDLLYLEGYNLVRMPLSRRKEILREALPALPKVKYSDHVVEDGVAFFKLAIENGLEGIIAKNALSQYRMGVRSMDWLKIKTHNRQEAVIGGYTSPRGSRSNLGALLLGVYEGGDFIYIGHTGGGMDEADLSELKSLLDPLQRKNSPFKSKPKTNTPATWVEPSLVCEVRFTGWTDEGRMRQPIYLGIRTDKQPDQVRRELPLPVNRAVERKYMIRGRSKKDILEIDGNQVEVTNLRKVFWPEEALTKGDLISYYRKVSKFILPYLRDRPQSLNRFPNGIQGKHFYQKDVDDAPKWVKTVRIESESSAEGWIDFLVCQDEATLVYLANLGCIEMNPWNSRLGSLDQPDYLVIDLDPDERSFAEVVQVAQVTHEILDEVGATNLVKTSGQTGLHIYVPLGAQYSYEQGRQFAHLVGQLVHRRLPEITSLERNPKNRRGMIYLDYLQNSKGQTLAAPYSLRPKPGAPVSTPLDWEELHPDLSPLDFSYDNILERLEARGDLFSPILGPGIDMSACLRQLEQRFALKVKDA